MPSRHQTFKSRFVREREGSPFGSSFLDYPNLQQKLQQLYGTSKKDNVDLEKQANLEFGQEYSQSGRTDGACSQDVDGHKAVSSLGDIADMTSRPEIAAEFLSAFEHEISEVEAQYSQAIQGLISKHDSTCDKSELRKLYGLADDVTRFAYWNYLACVHLTEEFVVNSGLHSNALLLHHIRRTAFFQRSALSRLVENIIETYAEHFENGHLNRAKIKLLSSLTSPPHPSSQWSFILLCMVVPMLAAGIMAVPEWKFSDKGKIFMKSFRPIYRMCAAICFLIWCWSTVLYFWRRSRVNYLYVFGCDLTPKARLTGPGAKHIATELTLVTVLNLAAFVYCLTCPNEAYMGVHAPALPIALFIFFLLRLFVPGNHLSSHWGTRRTLLGCVFRVMMAPFGGVVTLQESLTADFLISLVKVFTDLQSSVCAMGLMRFDGGLESCVRASKVLFPLLSALPLVWRFMQCLRQFYDTRKQYPIMLNAAKYAIVLLVFVFGVTHSQYGSGHASSSLFRNLWLISTIVSTMYCWVWDIIFDWGLGDRKGPNWLLRPTLMYSGKKAYYLICIANLIIRFYWTVMLIPIKGNPFYSVPHGADLHQNVLLPALIFLELIRRSVWSLLRVENAALGSDSEFESFRIPLPLFYEKGYRQLHLESDVKKRQLAEEESEHEKLHRSQAALVAQAVIMLVSLALIIVLAIEIDNGNAII